MRLSEIDITRLLEAKTQDFIREADFSTLKNRIISVEPIDGVLKAVNSVLSEAHEFDKTRTKAEISAQFCQAQIDSDEAEARHDAKAEADDSLLRAQLEVELASVHDQAGLCSRREEDFRARLRMISSQICTVESHIATEQASQIHVDIEPHHHHSHHHGHDHHHGHAHTNVHFTPMVHVHADSVRLIQLRQEKNRLQAEQSSLEVDLQRTINESRRLAARRQELHRTRTVTIPQRDHDRAARAKMRDARALARLREDEDFEQLSQQNRANRTRQIQLAHNELLREYTALQTGVEVNSYDVLRRQLQQELKADGGTKLSYAERSCLQQVLQSMDEYFAARARERSVRSELATATSTLGACNRELQQRESRVSALTVSNPSLGNANKRLDALIEELNGAVAVHRKRRNWFLSVGILMGGSSIVAAGVGTAIMLLVAMATSLIPVLFVPSAIFLVAATALLTAALVMNLRKGRDSRQITSCEHNKERNISQISQQTEELGKLEAHDIPQLRTDIGNTEESIRRINQSIASIVEQKNLHMEKARSAEPVLVSQSANSSFYSTDSPKPSAPLLDAGLPQHEEESRVDEQRPYS